MNLAGRRQLAEDKLWQAVLTRDARSDGRFVYAVQSTGVYCRPSCPSRRPRRESVRFFAGPDPAELAGFRECRRCHPRAGVPPTPGVDHVRKATVFIASHADEPITLAALASHVGTSPFHLQRTFSRLLGISPRAYQDALRAQRFRRDLRTGKPLTGAIYDAGYGSSSRVYEQRPTGRGLTPAQYRRGATGASIAFTIVDSSLGRLLVAGTDKGLCSVKLGDRDEALEQDLRTEYPAATIARERGAFAEWVRALGRGHLFPIAIGRARDATGTRRRSGEIPSISSGVIAFESDPRTRSADVYVYVIATNTLLQVTNTPGINDTLNDVTVLGNGDVRVVWSSNDGPGQNVYGRTFSLPQQRCLQLQRILPAD